MSKTGLGGWGGTGISEGRSRGLGSFLGAAHEVSSALGFAEDLNSPPVPGYSQPSSSTIPPLLRLCINDRPIVNVLSEVASSGGAFSYPLMDCYGRRRRRRHQPGPNALEHIRNHHSSASSGALSR